MELKVATPLLAMMLIGMTGCGGSGSDGGGGGDVVDEPIPATIAVEGIETWKGGAAAAYTLMHDDFCQSAAYPDGTVENWQALQQRGLVAGFGAVSSWCGKTYGGSTQTITPGYENFVSEFKGQDYFQIMAVMEQAGMEIVNHSLTHATFFNKDEQGQVQKDQPIDSWQNEIDAAGQQLAAKGLSVSYFAFPEDQSNDSMLSYLKDQQYRGARGGEHGINAADILDEGDGLAPFKANFDCFNANQTDDMGYNCSAPAYRSDPLKLYLDAAIAAGGWGVRELHGIDSVSWGYVTPEQYIEHLDYVKQRVDDGSLWVDTPTQVTKYWAAKTYCGTPTANGNQLSYNQYDDYGNCVTYGEDTELDVVITAQAANGIYAMQDGESLAVTALGNGRYRLSLSPFGSSVSVYESVAE